MSTTSERRHSILEPNAPESRTTIGPGHPFRAALLVVAVGYAVLAITLLGIGLALTHPLNGTVGQWDEHVNRYFAEHRTAPWNSITQVATAALDTLPVILFAAVTAGFLALRKRLREAAFLILALVVEITVFLPVTFIVDRPRPAVPRMNMTPATSSFPSGHTAAATVLFFGIALIIAVCTTAVAARVVSTVVAVGLAALVGFARVYRGLHHPSDVFVGFLFGLSCLAIAALAVRHFVARRDRSNASRSEHSDCAPTRNASDTSEPVSLVANAT
jgi:membrane-associated phospholipid phosphatase